MKKYFQKIKLYICLALIIFSASVPSTTFAYDNNHFYSSNDILFYDAKDNSCVGSASSGVSTIAKSAELQNIFQSLLNGGMNAGQAAAVMGNMYQESSFNSAVEESNGMGYGLAQWTGRPGRRANLENFAKSKGVNVSDMSMQIEFLFSEYNTIYKSRLGSDFAGTDIVKSTTAWMRIFEVPLETPTNGSAGLYATRIPAAEKIYGFYQSLSPGSPVASSGCNQSGNGVVAGNIIQTAIGFALSKPASDTMNKEGDARDTYRTIRKQNNLLYIDVTDCGGFIGTVMNTSGVDPNYPPVGVATQYTYAQKHPEKYLIINNAKESDLQPGDILITADKGHTTLHTGNTGYTDVDASFGQRVPSVRDSSSYIWMLKNNTSIIRVLK
jgi:hypothetical protein